MNIFNLFKKRSYKDSPRREIYEEIAQQLGCTPQRVYEIAHGKRPKDLKDDKIVNYDIYEALNMERQVNSQIYKIAHEISI